MTQEATDTRSLMLDIARGAIEFRARMDDHPAGEYDATHDPEGYITSLINALHQWCHVNGIDWEDELTRAKALFEQDAEGLGEGADGFQSQPDIAELRCPQCGHTDSFMIEVSECLLMFADGVCLAGDNGQDWGDWSYCRCHECNHTGVVWQFRAAKHGEEKSSGRHL